MIKNIISIDISTELLSVAIKYKNKIFTQYSFTNKKKKQNILLLIHYIININNININKINYFIINKGPGSLLGYRISYIISNIFKLKYKNIKIIKFNTFQIILNNIKKKKIKYKNSIICIYNSINNILLFNIKYKKIIKFNNFNKFKKKIISNLNKINKIFVNNYQFKNNINIFYKKKIYIIYPKAKYMLF